MIIGRFFFNRETQAYKGDILTLGFQFAGVEITPTGSNSEKEPDFRIIAEAAAGHVELGAGWKRVSDRGLEFVSISLDGPNFAAPINTALFTDKGEASLVWSRPKKAFEKKPLQKQAA